MATTLNGSAYRDELTPVAFLERAGVVHADRIAVIDGSRIFTFREWRARSRRLAWALRGAGLQRKDRVAVLALNSEPLLLSHFAVPQSGGILVAINTRLNADEVAYILKHSGSRYVFYSPELAGQLERASLDITRIDLGSSFEDFLAKGSEDVPESLLEDEYETIAIDYTSGTTGAPKGVMYHYRGAYLNALAMVIENHLSTDSVFLWTLPMFHCNGWSHTWAVVAAGARSVCLPRIETTVIWRLLDSAGITHFNAAPTVLTMLAADPTAHPLARRVRVCTGGAPPSPTLIARMRELNIELVHLYGLTECYGPATINIPQPGDDRLTLAEQAQLQARQGVPHITMGAVRVVDERMRDVPADGETIGEVVIRGNTVMKGYYDQPQDTAQALEGGWLHTGDLAVVHRDRYIELRDRKKDIIISGGENISSIEVEQAIDSHDSVLECAVIPIADEKWGEVPKAFVTLKPGHTATAEEIIEYCRARIAHFKCPQAVEFGELPKTSTGKIQKFVLRTRELDRQARL